MRSMTQWTTSSRNNDTMIFYPFLSSSGSTSSDWCSITGGPCAGGPDPRARQRRGGHDEPAAVERPAESRIYDATVWNRDYTRR